MAVDRHEPDSTRELRLEGFGLLVGGSLLLGLLVGAFFLGRWVERGVRAPVVLGADTGGPLAEVATREPDADAGRGQTYFDSLEGAEKQPEPAREVRNRQAAAPPAALAAAAGGDYFVQVGALRDEHAASELIDALKAQGYGVRLFSEREGQGLLYKVRVGGYDSEQGARDAAGRLRSAGYAGAWVTTPK